MRPRHDATHLKRGSAMASTPEFQHLRLSRVKDVVIVEIISKDLQGPAAARELGAELSLVSAQDWAKQLLLNFSASSISAAPVSPSFSSWSASSRPRGASSRSATSTRHPPGRRDRRPRQGRRDLRQRGPRPRQLRENLNTGVIHASFALTQRALHCSFDLRLVLGGSHGLFARRNPRGRSRCLAVLSRTCRYQERVHTARGAFK